jgi:uncharacterized protein (UPF0332 family)
VIKPKDLLKEARILRESARNNETRRRTIIGRVYYAVFHAVSELACHEGYKYNRDSAKTGRHEDLIRYAIVKGQSPSLREAGSILGELKTFRRTADYVLDYPSTFDDMEDCLEKAEYVVEDLLADC